MNTICDWIQNNMLDCLLIIVTASAFIVYFVQRHEKRKEAARLIVIQINALMEGIQDIASRISGGRLNSEAFYESVPLMEENYWEKYKHVFVKEMSSQSINEIDKLFQYARIIQDQQLVITSLQKNHFLVVQQVLCNIEGQFIMSGVTCPPPTDKVDATINLLKIGGMPSPGPEQESQMKELISQMWQNASNLSINQDATSLYATQKSLIEKVYNNVGFTSFIPEQPRISLEKSIQECALLETKATEGFRKLCKIAKFN